MALECQRLIACGVESRCPERWGIVWKGAPRRRSAAGTPSRNPRLDGKTPPAASR